MEHSNRKLGFNSDRVIPNLTSPFLSFLERFNLKDKTLLEIGGGDSTIYFSNIFKKVITYDHNRPFLNKIKKHKLKNVELKLLEKDIGKNKIFTKNSEKADLIIIDNDPKFIDRFYFAKLFHDNKNITAEIVLDNGTWNMKAYKFLKENYYCSDFPGYNRFNENTVTSFFFKKIQGTDLIYPH